MKRCIALVVLVFSSNSFALTPPYLVEADGKSTSTLKKMTAQIEKGSVVLLGELHHTSSHHNNQLDVINSLIEQGHNVHLGMEFFNYTDQYDIYNYTQGLTEKDDFLKKINWSTPETFEFYSPLVNAVDTNGGAVLGLNIPRPITSKIAKNGVESLTTSEFALLPYPLMYGSDFYFERFSKALAGGHVPEDQIQNYFWSQSVWDDVMSWRALEFMKKSPTGTLVIIVGDFHVAYGGGLADVLKRKGFDKVITVSQTVKGDLSDVEIFDEISPHPKYGQRADWIWVTQ